MNRNTLLVILFAILASSPSVSAKQHKHCHYHCYWYGGGYWHGCDNVEIIEKKSIYFEGISGYNQLLNVSPESSYAAIFHIKNGIPNSRIKLEVKERRLFPYGGRRGDNVKMTNVTFGGSVSSKGYATLDRWGDLYNIRVGAKVKVSKKNKKNLYIGTPKLKLRYLRNE